MRDNTFCHRNLPTPSLCRKIWVSDGGKDKGHFEVTIAVGKDKKLIPFFNYHDAITAKPNQGSLLFVFKNSIKLKGLENRERLPICLIANIDYSMLNTYMVRIFSR